MNCKLTRFLAFCALLCGVAAALISAAAAATPAQTQTQTQTPAANDWLTLTGFMDEPFDSHQNVVQANAQSIKEAGTARTMQIRVSRSLSRLSWDGVPHRSYVATVEFDCVQKTARYQSVAYYLQPAWRGEVSQTSVYPAGQYRPIALRDIHPNPTARIIRAACHSKSVISN